MNGFPVLFIIKFPVSIFIPRIKSGHGKNSRENRDTYKGKTIVGVGINLLEWRVLIGPPLLLCQEFYAKSLQILL